MLQENEAGRRVRHLLKHEWHTQSTHTPTSAVEAFSERAFYGTYQLNLRYRGEVIYNGTLEHSSKDPQRYFLTVDSNLPADQIFRTSGWLTDWTGPNLGYKVNKCKLSQVEGSISLIMHKLYHRALHKIAAHVRVMSFLASESTRYCAVSLVY